MSFSAEVKRELCRLNISKQLLRAGGGLRHPAVLQHLQQPGGAHHH